MIRSSPFSQEKRQTGAIFSLKPLCRREPASHTGAAFQKRRPEQFYKFANRIGGADRAVTYYSAVRPSAVCNIIEYRSKNETVERNFYESRILNLGLCFYPGDIAHLFFLIFQRHSGDVGDRIREFSLRDEWRPLNGEFGIFPMIIGSLYVTAGAIIVGVPIGLLCAMFMARFCPKRLYSVLKPAIDLMAGIPFHRLRFLRYPGHRTGGPQSLRHQRKGTAHGVPAPGNDDIAYDYRSL